VSKETQQYFLIDFDSTFIQSEGLEELAALALKNNPQKKSLLKKMEELTNKGMDGTIAFDVSLRERINLLQANKSDINKLCKVLKRKISQSILRNKAFFKQYKNQIYIVSGGFKEFILPVVTPFGISPDHIFANTFIFDKKGDIIGIDNKNPLSQENGKVKLLKSLKLKGDITVIGDGYTDYRLKKSGLIKEFIGFTENIERDIVMKKADHIAPTFDEFLYSNQLPMSLSYPKNRISVLLLENVHNDAVSLFEKEGYSVSYYNKSLPEEELIKKIKNVSILGIRSRTQVTANLLNHAPHLLTIGVFGIGINNIDIPTTGQHGIAAFNAPYSSTRSVVELTIGEMLVLSRRVFDKSIKLQNGIWDKSTAGCHEIKGKTLGIIGYGTIGSQVGILAEALGMHVLFYDISDKPILGNAQKCMSMKELLKKSDIITVHVDGNKNNINLIGEKEFHLMKEGVLFLNASRGFVVDIPPLVKYLKSGKIHGAAVDVFPKEPKGNDEPFTSALQNIPNVILTPHIGGASEEGQKNIANFVPNKIINYINTGNTYLSVSIPNIQIPKQKNTHRLLHLHKNVPGILAHINTIFAGNDINIIGQYLKTDENVGYAITDIEKEYDNKILEQFKKIPNTIRFRVLY
jgi:D-3-phosphoglycerate dehydrogenase